eukprot:648674-Pyramimonas_sp.AAC.1
MRPPTNCWCSLSSQVADVAIVSVSGWGYGEVLLVLLAVAFSVGACALLGPSWGLGGYRCP